MSWSLRSREANWRTSGRARITTIWSSGSPSITDSATPRYTSGANRRLSSTSRWQSAARALRVSEVQKIEMYGLVELVDLVSEEEKNRDVRLSQRVLVQSCTR